MINKKAVEDIAVLTAELITTSIDAAAKVGVDKAVAANTTYMGMMHAITRSPHGSEFIMAMLVNCQELLDEQRSKG